MSSTNGCLEAVVDVSPGSGSLAVACLKGGIQYFGMCGSAVHVSWLSGVVDRTAAKLISTSGATMHQEPLAQVII